MARRKRSVVYVTGSRRGRRRGRGGFKLPKLFDISQTVFTSAYLGYFVAADQLMKGQPIEAANTITSRAVSIKNNVDIALGNAIIGINRKIVRGFGGRFVRKFIA